MDVNLIGMARVSKAFLPLLRRTQNSRLVLVGSCAGRVVGHGLTAYSMTKFAVRAFADGLRREVKTFNIRVSVLEPLVFGTSMGNKDIILGGLRRRWEATPDDIKQEHRFEKF